MEGERRGSEKKGEERRLEEDLKLHRVYTNTIL